MTNLVDTISDLDDKEEKRKLRVTASSMTIFDGLWNALKQRIQRYNERHPQDRLAPNAVWIHHEWDSRHRKALIRKNAEPKNWLSIVFEINSGEMGCQFALGCGAIDATITLDVREGTPAFYMEGDSYSTDEIADALLGPILSPKWPPEIPATPTSAKRPIGFKP